MDNLNEKSDAVNVRFSSSQQVNDGQRLNDSTKKPSVFTLIASDGGWRFKLPGTTEVELLTEDGGGPLVPLNRCRVGQRVVHLGRVHKILEIVVDGIKRRLVHQSQERAL